MAGKGKVDMRNAIVLTTVLLILAPVCVKAVEPIGCWKFDEKDGTTAKDSSGNGFDATVDLGGGPDIWAPGQGFDSNGCAKFTAQQTVTIPDAIWTRVKDQMSIAFWVNQDPCAPPDEKWPGPWGIATTEGISHPDPNWLKLRAFVPTPNKAIDIGNDSENIYWQPTSDSDFAGSWNLYVFVKDANEYSLRLYHNGDKVAERFGTMEPMPKIKNFMLGGRMYPTADWSGKIDDFRIYNRALSQDDVMKLYLAKPQPKPEPKAETKPKAESKTEKK
jgi:hypothetical protein